MSAQDQGASPLWYARQVIADIAAHDDVTIRTACITVRDHSDDATEISDAWDLCQTLDPASTGAAA